MLLGKCTEVEEFLKYTRLLANDRSFYQQYETSLAKIQTRISRLHRELSNSKNEKKKWKVHYVCRITTTALEGLFLKLNLSCTIYIPKYIPGINEPIVFKLYFYGKIDN